MPKTIHEVEKNGNLYFLLNAFIGAINKIGDALIRSASSGNSEQMNRVEKKIDELLQILKAEPEEVQRLRERIKSQADALEGAVQKQQPK